MSRAWRSDDPDPARSGYDSGHRRARVRRTTSFRVQMQIPSHVARLRARWAEGSGPRPPIHEPGPGQRSVWSFPRPPAIEAVGERIRIEHAGRTIVDSTDALAVLETSHPPSYYVPASDVDASVLRREPGRGSMCEWKGQAVYYAVVLGDTILSSVGWSYPDPFDDFAALAGRLSFYCAPFDACWVGQARARPQPGGFYGGWVTQAFTGPFKGIPGSSGW